MIPLIVGAVGAGLAAVDMLTSAPGGPHDPDGSNGASPSTPVAATRAAMLAAQRLANPTLYVNGVMPNDTQRRKYAELRRHAMPEPVVARVYTPPPQGRNARDLQPWVEQVNAALGSDKAGYVLAPVYTMETGAGNKDRDKVACYNYNLGNFKGNGQSRGPVYFLRDNLNSLDVYPSFETFSAGANAWFRLFNNSNYNRVGMKGARQSILTGDLDGLNAAMGAGGYAASYRNPTLLRSIYRGLVSRGVIRNGLR